MADVIRFPRGMGREGQIRRLAVICEALPMDAAWKVTITEDKPKRSDTQNALLWSLYGQILEKGGEAMGGWTKDDLHEFFLIEHFGGEPKKMFERFRIQPNRRSSRLNKIEFAEFTDHIVRFMAERGVVLDMPGDL